MKSIAIICEYNLFHNGHLRQINMIRDKFSESDDESTVISLMSGNWVQRGGPAVLPAHIRAEAAVKCGTDLVLELPYPWSGGSAEYFARGAVDILNAIGGIDFLCFGSESGDLDVLNRAAGNTLSDEYVSAFNEVKKLRRSGIISEIILRGEVYFKIFGEKLPVLPNDILGLEYIRALRITGSKIKPFAVKRQGTETATESRAAFGSGNQERLRMIVPPKAYEIYMNHEASHFDSLGSAIIAGLRLANRDDLSSFEGITGGLDRRLCDCAARSVTLKELFEMTATKRYTNARLRRTVMNCMLSVKGEYLKENPRFTRLLAANKKGTDFLRRNGGNGLIVLTKPSHHKRYEDDAVLTAQIQRRYKAEALYSLTRGESAEEDLKRIPFIIKD
ncbi:MAG: nucleotidyltransferase family protein [Eubacteriales bacterium]